MNRFLAISFLTFASVLSAFAQEDKKEVRDGNRKFRHNDFKNSEIQYRKALVKDSTSFAASYDLASALYMQKDYDGASKALGSIAEAAPESGYAGDYAYNLGCTAIQQKDWDAAIKAFRTTLLEHPEDMDAKENYIYAKLMKQNQQNQDQDQNQDQNQNQNQDQNQDQNQQNQDQKQNQDQNQDNKSQPQQQKVSPQQAQQMLKAIQAKEKETQDKVEKEKAAKLDTRQKEKNW